jgi:tetratricopeptide (TPR) repeat protein
VFMYSQAPVASWLDVAAELLLLAALAGLTLALTVRRHPAALPGLWFFLILAPSSSLLPIATEVAAEHRMYLPLAAVMAVVLLTVRSLLVRLGPGGSRVAAGTLLVAAVMALGATTHARNRDYRSIEALMRVTVEDSPSNLRARVIYGGHLLGLERYADAEAQLRVAVTLPERVPAEQGLAAAAHMYLGSSIAAQGRTGEAIPHLEQALTLSPSLSETHAFLGEAYASQGRLAEAAAAFDHAVEQMPSVQPVLARAATVQDALSQEHAKAGRFVDAIAAARRAAQLAHAAGDEPLAAAAEQRRAQYELRLRDAR